MSKFLFSAFGELRKDVFLDKDLTLNVVYYIVFDCTVYMVGVVCTHAYTYACDVCVHAVCTRMAMNI